MNLEKLCRFLYEHVKSGRGSGPAGTGFGSGKIIRIILDCRIPDRSECTLYLYDLAMSPVVGICEKGLGQVGEEVLEYGGALVHRELVIVQIQRDSLHINIELILLGNGWSS
jgi:hypothetical protein